MAKTKKEDPVKQEDIAESENTDQEVDTAGNQQENQAENEDKAAQLEKELQASKEAHIRTLAEYDNYRKRSVKEKEGIYADAKAMCMKELLSVVDNFERALEIKESNFESYKKGVEIIYTNLMDTFKKLGVEAFGEVGEEFDPNFHNGVMHVDDPEKADNVIDEVFSKGYKLGDKVLRPAMVKVAN